MTHFKIEIRQKNLKILLSTLKTKPTTKKTHKHKTWPFLSNQLHQKSQVNV